MPAIDLADAVLQTLRASPAAAAFGDTWDPTAQSGVQKFFGDFANASGEPYAVLTEPQQTRQYYTKGQDGTIPFVATGTFQAHVYATDRTQARTLGEQVASVLNDRVPSWTGANLMMFRSVPSGFIPTPATGPTTPAVFAFAVSFQFMYQGSM